MTASGTASENATGAGRLLFWAIFIFAAVARFKDLATGLPLHSLYGEMDSIAILRNILQTGDLNPHQFDLPGLAYYIFLPFLILFYLAGHYTGHFANLAEVADPSLLFVGRGVCALFGVLSVLMVYRIGRHYSRQTGLLSMAVFAAVPQHIEYCHMLRPEIPAIFFLLVAIDAGFRILKSPNRFDFWILGISAGAAFALKYMIGLPILPAIFMLFFSRRKEVKLSWVLESVFFFFFIFAATNPFQLIHSESAFFWRDRARSLYTSGEEYYGKNMVAYYLEFLTEYNYSLALIILAGMGFLYSAIRTGTGAPAVNTYPLLIFAWLCSFKTRRTHGLLPLHPFLSVWIAIALIQISSFLRAPFGSRLFRGLYGILLCAILAMPYYRTGVQSFLLSQIDNRSKAELWITNRLPKGSKIALLQFSQVELDSNYFIVESFVPRDYVLNNKDFEWFRRRGFNYIITSSGQYMRYFTEGEAANFFGSYFMKLFKDGQQEGTLVLDLVTHPLLIPDYRIKVFSTRSETMAPDFLPAIDLETTSVTIPVPENATVSLEPGYYALRIPVGMDPPSSITVSNRKLNEVILSTRGASQGSRFPFSVFPIRQNASFSLLAHAQQEISTNQILSIRKKSGAGLYLERIPPSIKISRVDFLSLPQKDLTKPYFTFEQDQPFRIQCHFRNRSSENVTGYVEAFLSKVGEPQPWKNFEGASGPQEFFLEPDQRIGIDIPMNTASLVGDFQLSYWIFTQQDVPFTPQNGGWFNKQIRVNDSRLGIHPVYGTRIP